MLGLAWGLAQGVRHALEPDHLAAVSTLVAERRSPRSAASYAAAWGLGHALVLLAVGGALIVVRARVPDELAAVFELAVAAMLVVLGARALARVRTRPAPEPAPHTHRPLHGSRAIVVGCIHGLAGSGALAALVLAQMPSPVAGLAYVAVYGGGAALGMATLAGVAGVPLSRLSHTRRGLPLVLATTGALSLALGLLWGCSAAHHL